MPTIVQRYPATVIAAVVVLVGAAIAAAILLGTDDAHSGRFATLIALVSVAVTTLLSVAKTESGNEAAEKAAVTAEEVAVTLNAAVADGAKTTPAALEALRLLVESTERANRAAETIERVTNGHANGELKTREDDSGS